MKTNPITPLGICKIEGAGLRNWPDSDEPTSPLSDRKLAEYRKLTRVSITLMQL